MNSVVCTLFEAHYHFGVAALTNSLYKNGFRGDVYAGYRGDLPKWANNAIKNDELKWEDAKTLRVIEGLQLHFLPLTTDYHLTNYKPDFMLALFEKFKFNGLFYFDPDIIIKSKLSFFEEWINLGVALVHEISSNDMPPTHPIRLKWHSVIKKANKTKSRDLYSYINGGFCGVSRKNINFLEDWKKITDTAISDFGMTANQWNHNYDRTYEFYAQDQDALNITAMCTSVEISEIGPEGMDFIPGGFTMSHSVGSPKPWNKSFLLSFVKGISPGATDKLFWQHTTYPILIYSKYHNGTKNLIIRFVSFLSRFYSKR
jgi:hypothetical protein